MSDTSSTITPDSQQDAQHTPSTSSQQQQEQQQPSPPPHTPQPQSRRFTSEDHEFLDNISSTLRSLSGDLQRWRRQFDERDTPQGRTRQARQAELEARLEAEWQAEEKARAIRQASELRRRQAREIERNVREAQDEARWAAVTARWSPEKRRAVAAAQAADDEAVRVALEAAGLGGELRRGGGSGGAGSSVHGQGQRQAGA